MIIKANCKINIGIDILHRRTDGYHDIATIMYPVKGLYDIIEVENNHSEAPQFISRGIKVDCNDNDNICIKAYRLMRERYGIGGAVITLDKRVPFGAGLGGGSSDGTAVLLALNEVFGLHLSAQELTSLAAELGSDTPFFVSNTPQLCEGRGEILTPVELDLSDLWIAIIKPDVSISTREAYAGVAPSIPTTPLIERIQQPISMWQQTIKNDFEKSIFLSHPSLEATKQQLIDAGAVYAAMSGSGSALFGLFQREEDAEKMRIITPYIYKM